MRNDEMCEQFLSTISNYNNLKSAHKNIGAASFGSIAYDKAGLRCKQEKVKVLLAPAHKNVDTTCSQHIDLVLQIT